MTSHDVYLISPEIILVGLGILIVALDLFVGRQRLLTYVSLIGILLAAISCFVLWNEVSATQTGSLGGVYGAILIDKFALFFKFLILTITALIMMTSADYMGHMKKVKGEFMGLILFSATGMMLLPSAVELITIYVSMELVALPLVALSAFLATSNSSEAGLKFLILSGVSSALLLYGMVLVYGLSGSTYLTEISQTVSAIADMGFPFGSHVLLMGVLLIVAGLGFKISSVPFHMWVPDVYGGGPLPVVAFLSVASKAVGFAIVLRVFYVAFPVFELDWAMLFAVLAAVSMTLGNILAMVQGNIRRLMGYSTIAHAGYMMVGLAAIASRTQDGSDGGSSALLFYLVAYAATNLASFFAIIAISNKVGSDKISDFAGIARRDPVLAFVLALGLVSLIGVPPTALFIGKIFLFTAAIQSDLVWLAILGVANSVLSAYYYLKVIRTMYSGDTVSDSNVRPSLIFQLALGFSGVVVLVLGIMPGIITWITDAAARSLTH